MCLLFVDVDIKEIYISMFIALCCDFRHIGYKTMFNLGASSDKNTCAKVDCMGSILTVIIQFEACR